ncbi:MAG TPA: class I SAM-dependent methyltransferase [Acidimicrobiales bacterium]|nr:class I SAM-dependent methyltransferase [Acidimicrobiales bacterium]
MTAAPVMTARRSAADAVRPIVRALLGTDDPPLRIEFWDGSALGADASGAKVVVRSPLAVRRLMYAPNELGLGRAFVAGELDVEGDVFEALALRDIVADRNEHLEIGMSLMALPDAVRAARELGVLGKPLPPPPEEARLTGRRHSRERDAQAISHHYDVGNDFYSLFLGRTMTYSCAYFARAGMTLDEAQEAKYDLVCRKLGLEPGMRMLDVGCGWGGLVMHAARHYGVRAVGVTVAREQAELASKRVAEAGLAGSVEIRLQDYRDIDDGPYDAISSIGMFEHVGLERLGEYFDKLRVLVRPQGRVLNHGISRPPAAKRRFSLAGRDAQRFDKRSFIERYVFPDGELHEVGTVVSSMQQHGLEVRDVQSLREHYALTLRCWVANLQSHWDEAVRYAGQARARVWLLYMAGSALNFEHARTSIHQVLAVKSDGSGASGMPLTRASYLA